MSWLVVLFFFAALHPVCGTAAESRRIELTKTVAKDGGRHALLIGINEYPDPDARLKGAVNDAMSWQDTLTSRYNFPSANVTTLVDRQATKANIIKELGRIEQESKPGDLVFIFFSGHGTSSYDSDLKLDMGAATGALVPVDVKTTGSKDAIINSLLIGSRDLRPIMERMDRDRQVIVVVDACYSGSSFRSLDKGTMKRQIKSIPKFLPLSGLPQNSSTTTQTCDKDPSPYKNIVYISAANKCQKAMDLSSDPFDGKAHGALTSAMLRGMRGDADSNNDGVVSYAELLYFAIGDTQKQGHTPQLMNDDSFDVTRRIFNVTPKLKKEQRSAFSVKNDLLVRLEGDASRLSNQLINIPRLKLTDGEYDLLVTAEEGEYLLSMGNGDMITGMKSAEEVRLRIERYQAVGNLVGLKNPDSTFNSGLLVGGVVDKRIFMNGEQITFGITADKTSYPLLLDIDPQGFLSVIFPATAADIKTTATSGTILSLGNAGTVSEPLGVEILKLFAFRKPVEALKHFAGKSPIDPMSSEFAELEKIIKGHTKPGGDWAETTVEVVTVKR